MLVDEADCKLARFVVSETRGRFAVTPMHHLIAQPTGVTHFVEYHELILATEAEYSGAFAAAGLEGISFDAQALPKGAWIGRSRLKAPRSEPPSADAIG
jgi:hypothetical protein